MFAALIAAALISHGHAHAHHAPIAGLAHRPVSNVYTWPVTYSPCREVPWTGQIVCATSPTTSLRARAF